MPDREHERRLARQRAKRYRQRARLRAELESEAVTSDEIAEQYATPLVTGLLPEPEREPWTYDPVKDGEAVNPRAVPGQGDYVETPYGATARKRARQEAAQRASEVVDCTRPREQGAQQAREQEAIKRELAKLRPDQRRQSVHRESAIRRAQAEIRGKMITRAPIDWAMATASDDPDDQAAYAKELARQQAEHEARQAGPHRYPFRFIKGSKDSGTDEAEMIEAPQGFRR